MEVIFLLYWLQYCSLSQALRTERIDKILVSREKKKGENKKKNPSFLLWVSRLSAENCAECCAVLHKFPSDFKLQQLTKADRIKESTQMSLNPSDDNSM